MSLTLPQGLFVKVIGKLVSYLFFLYILRDKILDRKKKSLLKQKLVLSDNCVFVVACTLTISSGPLADGVAFEVNCMKKTSSHLVSSSGLQS